MGWTVGTRWPQKQGSEHVAKGPPAPSPQPQHCPHPKKAEATPLAHARLRTTTPPPGMRITGGGGGAYNAPPAAHNETAHHSPWAATQMPRTKGWAAQLLRFSAGRPLCRNIPCPPVVLRLNAPRARPPQSSIARQPRPKRQQWQGQGKARAKPGGITRNEDPKGTGDCPRKWSPGKTQGTSRTGIP